MIDFVTEHIFSAYHFTQLSFINHAFTLKGEQSTKAYVLPLTL